MDITVGIRFPVFATSMGRMLVAWLPPLERDSLLRSAMLPSFTPVTITDPVALVGEIDRVATQGWSIVDGELETGLLSVAVPIHGADGVTVAALNISTSVTRDSIAHQRSHHLPLVLATAGNIQQDLRRF